jgi:hypothetical protein
MHFHARLLAADADTDRRGSLRRVLRLELTGSIQDAETADLLVHDLSSGGALLESPVELAIGDTVELDLPAGQPAEATVIWNSGKFYGCEFSEAIDKPTLSAALLRSEPSTLSSQTPQVVDLTEEVRAINSQLQAISSRLERAIKQLSNERH